MTATPSGEQFEIRHGDQRATIVEVGGGVREYKVAGRSVLDPYPIGEMCDGAHGAVLVPWPNRLADGRYRFDGVDYQVALTEPDKGNAIHGFLRWRSWRASEHTSDRVVVGTTLYPMMGYPFVSMFASLMNSATAAYSSRPPPPISAPRPVHTAAASIPTSRRGLR